MDRDWPLGTLQGENGSIVATIYGERSDPAVLRRLPLERGVMLGDVARVTLSQADSFSAYDGNGHPAIALSILRAPGASVEAPIDDAIGQLPLLRARFPNIRFEVADTQKDLIDTSNANMIGALRDAIIFTSVIILFFLANWRAVATALISIPIVFLLTLGALWLLGREMNIFLMIGIILALGMLVDDAVVVLENIERHLVALAEDTTTAIMRATEEVLSPLLIGTLATAVVIAPLMFVGGFPQQNFSHMILAVLVAVFASYFVAVTVIPRLSAFWYRNGVPPRSRFERAIEALYQRSIGPGASLYLRLLEFAARGGAGRRFAFLLAGCSSPSSPRPMAASRSPCFRSLSCPSPSSGRSGAC